jgi:hypothetical protein
VAQANMSSTLPLAGRGCAVATATAQHFERPTLEFDGESRTEPPARPSLPVPRNVVCDG